MNICWLAASEPTGCEPAGNAKDCCSCRSVLQLAAVADTLELERGPSWQDAVGSQLRLSSAGKAGVACVGLRAGSGHAPSAGRSVKQRQVPGRSRRRAMPSSMGAVGLNTTGFQGSLPWGRTLQKPGIPTVEASGHLVQEHPMGTYHPMVSARVQPATGAPSPRV